MSSVGVDVAMQNSFEFLINDAFENHASMDLASKTRLMPVIDEVIQGLDEGIYRVCEKIDGVWQVHQWLKKAILLAFILKENRVIHHHIQDGYDKLDLKEFITPPPFRFTPGAIMRKGAFIDQGVVLMPCFVNIGARIMTKTCIDTWATIGSCAQIGAHCHISGGAGIGGVLEPLQANPVIIENHCFIGARSEIVEGVIVGEGSVISMGVFIGASTKIVDRQSGAVTYGKVPPYSVVVPGVMPASEKGGPQLACAVIIKQVDEKTRSKTSINELLRL